MATIPSPRRWNVVLHVHRDDRVTVRVKVDARLLLPSLDTQLGDLAPGYIADALVDFQPGDTVLGTVQGPAVVLRCQTFPALDPFLRWVNEMLTDARRLTELADQVPSPSPRLG